MTVDGYRTIDPVGLSSLATKVNRTPHRPVRANGVSRSTSAPLDAGTYVPHLGSRFEILEQVRVDATGMVYKVYDNDFGLIAAVKVLPYFNLSQSVEARFVRDFKAMLSLRHPNILEVYEYGKTLDGAPYMVMEHFQGEDLGSIIERLQSLSPVRAEIMFLQLADALAHAHRQGLIHRDVNPSNVLVMVDDDGNQTIKLIDFGISKTVAENIPEDLRAGGIMPHESKHYISPEQIRGNVFDPRSDLYSLGCLMYEVLAGRPPFTTDDEHLNAKPLRLRRKKSGHDIPKQLEYCVLRCLEKEASARFKDADALIYHLTSSVANAEAPQLRPAVPWLGMLKVLACISTALIPFLAAKLFSAPLWMCFTIYSLAAGAAMIYAAQNQDLNYRLRKRGSTGEE